MPRAQMQIALQGKVKGGSDVHADRYTCSQCVISYNVPKGRRPLCPLCEAQRQMEALRDTIFKLTNELNRTSNELDATKSQVDIATAMRGAVDTTSPEDIAWLKSVIYHWKMDRTKVALKATHGVAKRKGKAPVNGFVALFRDGAPPDAYVCNSVGGMALAGYLVEATVLVGQIKAVEYLARAVSSRMTSDVDG